MKHLLLVLVILALFVVPTTANTLFGVVWDQQHLVGTNGATVVIWNATDTIQNVTFAYGPTFFPGVFWFDGLPANEIYSINATKAGMTQSLTGTINTGGFENKTVVAGVDGKIYRSSDSGGSWALASNFAQQNTTSIANLGLEYGLLADTSTSGWLFNSTNGGSVWSYVTNVFGIDSGTGPGRANKKPLLSLGSGSALAGLSSGYHGVWNTTNSGLTWSATTGWWTNRSAYQFAVLGTNVTAATNANEIWNSTDGGKSWARTVSFGSTITNWSERDGTTTVVMPDGSIVLMGGYDVAPKKDVWRSKDGGVSWALVNASAGWSARDFHTSVVMPDGSIVLMGGYDGHPYNNDVWRSTDNGATWTLQTASAGWSKRYTHTTVALPDGSIVLMGGYDGVPNYKNDTWKSVNNGATWTLVNASAGWSKRNGHASVVIPDGSIVLMGGRTTGGVYTNDTWRSTDGGNVWINITNNPGWLARDEHTSVVMPDGSIVLMGGYNGVNQYNDVWRSTDNGATWTLQTASAGWSARYAHTSVVMPDGSIVVMGGYDSLPNMKNDVWKSIDKGVTWFPAGATTSIISLGNEKALAGTYNQTGSIWNSSDYGVTWKKSQDLTNVINVESLVNLGNGNVLAGVWGNFTSPLGTHQAQIWNSTNNGTTWQIAYNFTGETEIPSLLSLGNFTVLAGTFPGGKIYRSYDNGTTWSEIGSLGTEVGALSLTDLEYGLRTDLDILPTYNLTIEYRDSDTYVPITPTTVWLVTSGMLSSTTSTTTGMLDVNLIPYGYLTLVSSATGYTTDTRSMLIASGGNLTINLTSSQTNVQNIWYAPKQVRIQIVDYYQNPLPGTNVTANYIATTLPSTSISWLSSAFGVSTAVASEMTNSGYAMSGQTDNNGGLSFSMFSSIAYNLNIVNTTSGINVNKTLYPSDQEYRIRVPLSSQIPLNNTLSQMSLTRLPVYLLNSTPCYNLSLIYSDTSGLTTGLWFKVWARNGTYFLNRAEGAPGTSTIVDNFTICSQPMGTEVLWGYGAERSGT